MNQEERLRKLVVSKSIHLNNPYRLREKSVLVRLYEGLPNFLSSGNTKTRCLTARATYALWLLANILGLRKLKKQTYTLLRATYEGAERLEFRIRDTNSQFHSIYFRSFSKCYEPDVSAAIQTFLRADSVFVDVGSNWGHHSFAAVLSKKCTAVLFEPNPDVCGDISRIAHDLGISQLLSIHNVALSDRAGDLILEQHCFESGAASTDKAFSSMRLKRDQHLETLKALFHASSIRHRARAATLDSFSLDRANLIKIDAEGAELEILHGARHTLTRHRAIVIFEFHSGDLSTFDSFHSFFDSIQYRLYTIECHELADSASTFKLNIFPADALRQHHQYNLLAAPSDADLRALADA